MNDQRFRQHLETRFGWDALYRAHIPEMPQPSGRGECPCRCPFPDHRDDTPSFSVNVHTGLWNCRGCQRNGNYVHFRAWREPSEWDANTGEPIVDFNRTERALKIEHGYLNPVAPEWLAARREALTEQIGRLINSRKPWSLETLRKFGVGWDAERRRIVFPVHEGRTVVNCHLYALQPAQGEPKYLWHIHGMGGNFLWPNDPNRDEVALCEGEGDTLTLRELGFPGICSTGGASDLIPPGNWMQGKRVFIFPDTDDAGQRAARDAGFILRDRAASVSIVQVPHWEGRPDNADITDYIQHLRRQGLDAEQQRGAVRLLIQQAVPIPPRDPVLDAEPRSVTFAELFQPDNDGRHVEWGGQVMTRMSARYAVPVTWQAVCPQEGRRECNRCPMRRVWHGSHRHEIDPRERLSLLVIDQTDEDVRREQKAQMGVPTACHLVEIETTARVHLEGLVLMAPADEATGAPEDVERQRREVFSLMRGQPPVLEGKEYRFRGYVYPSRRNRVTALVDDFQLVTPLVHRFQADPELLQRMKGAFQVTERGGIRQQLEGIAQDVAAHHTRIFGRPDLHLLYLAVFFSVLSFPLFGGMVRRGWMEALVIGDTRTGKSETFRRMAETLGVGTHVDAKLASVAGLTSSITRSEITGERYAEPGIWPLNDGQIVCVDEFGEARQSLIEALSQTRASGKVTNSKAGGATFPARVRSLWLANPAEGTKVKEAAALGVELVASLIGKPEDISRFDAATVVRADEVPMEVLYTGAVEGEPRYPADLLRGLLSWLWSRTPEQVRFTEAAEAQIARTAAEMCRTYPDSIPLVEAAEQRQRLAKVALSVAALVFSCDEDAQVLEVRQGHVQAARELFSLWYDKEAMGYNRLRRWQERNTEVLDAPAVFAVLDSLGDSGEGKHIARRIVHHRSLPLAAAVSMFQTDRSVDGRAVLQRLGRLNVWRHRGGDVDFTPGMDVLQGYLNGSGPGPHPADSTRIDLGAVDWENTEKGD